MLPLFNLGFRPFFLGAGVFSILTTLLWMAVYSFGLKLPLVSITMLQWHAHEMIYGYTYAVIAGFLLTAVVNWTGEQTLHGTGLLLLFLCWCSSRLLWLTGTTFIDLALVLDLLFSACLVVALAIPVFRARNWKQIGILSKLLLLGVGNACFYLGLHGHLDNGIHISLYGGLYIIIGLMLTIGRRVIPFFIERGVGYEVSLYKSKWIDVSSLILFLLFFISDLFLQTDKFSEILCLLLFIIITVRLIGWHTPGIWKKPL
ncbi:MAG: NnrS family protein, partial [Thiotrichales bacterium]|nr:NnrS family protein [Thiotrichales bacterium]